MTGLSIQSEVTAALKEAALEVGTGEPFTVTLIRAGDVNESTSPPTLGADTTFEITALQSSVSFMDLQAGNTETGDIKLMLEAGVTEPTTSDKISMGLRQFSIKSVKPVQNAGVPYYYEVMASGGVSA